MPRIYCTFSVKLHRDACQGPIISSHHWFRYWLGNIRQQAIIWNNVDRYLCHHMALLGSNGLKKIPSQFKFYGNFISLLFHSYSNTCKWLTGFALIKKIYVLCKSDWLVCKKLMIYLIIVFAMPGIGLQNPMFKMSIYRQASNIRRTLVGNKIVDHLDVVGASSFST